MTDQPWLQRVNLARTLQDIRFSAACTSSMKGSLMAFDALKRQMNKSNELEWEVLGALFTSGVIQYARPFLKTQTKYGMPRKRNLSKESGFDKQLHRELLTVRNRLVAHHDLRAYDAEVVLQCITEQQGRDAVPTMLIGIFVQIAMAHSTLRMEMIERLCAHVASIVTSYQLELWAQLTLLDYCLRNRPGALQEVRNSSVRASIVAMADGANHAVLPAIETAALKQWGYSMGLAFVRELSFLRHGYRIDMDGSCHVSADLIELAELDCA